jgi:hypothetical protein
MKSLIYGFLLALTAFLIVLVLFLCGLASDPAKLRAGETIGFVAGLAAAIGFITSGIKTRRQDVPATESFTYGQAFGAGALVQLFASLFGLIGNYVYFAVINPNFGDIIVQAKIDKLEASGLSGDKLDRVENMLRIFSSPLAMTGAGFVNTAILGLIVALIAAAFLKRPAAEV